MNEDTIKQLILKESEILINEGCENPVYALSMFQTYLETKYNIRLPNKWTVETHADYRDLVYGRKN